MTMTNDLFPQHGDLVEIVLYKGYLFNCNNLTDRELNVRELFRYARRHRANIHIS